MRFSALIVDFGRKQGPFLIFLYVPSSHIHLLSIHDTCSPQLLFIFSPRTSNPNHHILNYLPYIYLQHQQNHDTFIHNTYTSDILILISIQFWIFFLLSPHAYTIRTNFIFILSTFLIPLLHVYFIQYKEMNEYCIFLFSIVVFRKMPSIRILLTIKYVFITHKFYYIPMYFRR
jgi:hypothetical protein